MPIDSLLKKLAARYWDQVASSWLRHLPQIDSPGIPPKPLSLNQDLSYLCEQARSPKPNILSSARGPAAGLRDAIFHESIYWLHKAVHSLSGAERKIAYGMLTWSVIDAYQSAYFSMRSLCAALGVVVCDYQSKSYVVDICRDFGSTKRELRVQDSAFCEDVAVYSIGVRFDHKDNWQIMQRLLRVLHNESWGEECSQKIIELKSKDFAHHRNRICYYVHEWLKNDMLAPDYDESFATQAIYKAFPILDTTNLNFTLHLAYVFARISLTAYWDVAKVGVILARESESLRGALDESRHPYYSIELASIISGQ